MKRAILNGIIAITILAGGAYQVHSQTISGSIGNGTVSRGASAKGAVVLTIPGGLHVNSNRPNSEYAIPTSVRVVGSGVKAGGVTYPRGKNRKFQFSDDRINVYEGRVLIPFTVSVPANFKGNSVKVRAVVRYQACTDEVCYPPKNREITLTARVR